MADRARTATDETDLGGELASAVDDAKGIAGDLKTAAVERGRDLLEGARQQATSFADQRKNDAAKSVSDIASSLRETGKTFEERPNIQALVGSAADGLEQLATGLRESSFADLYGEAEAYARRSPVVVGAVAAAAGFLLARFIKSSADELSASAAATRSQTRAPAARRPMADA
jgi:vacuolar-type H+-ATPase subunit H